MMNDKRKSDIESTNAALLMFFVAAAIFIALLMESARKQYNDIATLQAQVQVLETQVAREE